MVSRFLTLVVGHPWASLVLLLSCLYLLVIAVWLSVIDLRSHLLPNNIVYPSMGIASCSLALTAVLEGEPAIVWRVLLGGLALGAAYLFLRLLYPPGMGLGDVKLAVVLGTYLGYLSWLHLLYATIVTFLLGGLLAAALMLGRRADGQSAIPFGPLMFLGTICALLIPG
ncbi:prepilin peptidase [Psychromicrobium sp. YIM B11713]|uniref:prepilin peptidase n=1 Tax=Psychromicrobium sp. YIM B11713 TaxID=3145233 RepID=UPI00374E7AFF